MVQWNNIELETHLRTMQMNKRLLFCFKCFSSCCPDIPHQLKASAWQENQDVENHDCTGPACFTGRRCRRQVGCTQVCSNLSQPLDPFWSKNTDVLLLHLSHFPFSATFSSIAWECLDASWSLWLIANDCLYNTFWLYKEFSIKFLYRRSYIMGNLKGRNNEERLLTAVDACCCCSFPLSQGPQFIPADGAGNRDDAALQGSLLWTCPHQGGDRLLPQPSFYMDGGESREKNLDNMGWQKKAVRTHLEVLWRDSLYFVSELVDF